LALSSAYGAFVHLGCCNSGIEQLQEQYLEDRRAHRARNEPKGLGCWDNHKHQCLSRPNGTQIVCCRCECVFSYSWRCTRCFGVSGRNVRSIVTGSTVPTENHNRKGSVGVVKVPSEGGINTARYLGVGGIQYSFRCRAEKQLQADQG
jgi:hypothetical protein